MFQRVDPRGAGGNALGILVPPGARTLVVLRPRALAFDLLPAQWDGSHDHAPEFSSFSRDEAAGVARRVFAALELAVAAGINPVQTVGDARGERFQIWLRGDDFVWIACRRVPGQAYEPMTFATQAEATREAEKLAAMVWPALDARQEVYFNTQSFP
ncbi:MAG: hypothetical protein HYX68_01645 [Planctomycetes bacterium]|nr:hypothetical protein [Planctomycetota bacterium]